MSFRGFGRGYGYPCKEKIRGEWGKVLKEIILIKNGELALKGLNRRTFENALISNIRHRIKSLGKFNIKKGQSVIMIEPLEEIDLSVAVERIEKVFGIANFSRACVVEKDMDKILPCAVEYLKHELEKVSTFKVEARRSDKSFPLDSPAICKTAGAYILKRFPNLAVDVHNPQLTVTIEIRDFGACIRGGAIPGAGGMPVGTAGRAALLISGGIDSPVAGYMMAKRGVRLYPIHFASPPYTSERALQKVIDLLKQISHYTGSMTMYVVPFTHAQEEIRRNIPEDLFTIEMRRIMMMVSERIARRKECVALVTGESLGQVASQTMEALACTDEITAMPVFRPLIGMDKDEIVDVSKKIGAFEISILPYEDCCTVFTPKHPRTRPNMQYVKKAEEALDIDSIVQECIDGVYTIEINI